MGPDPKALPVPGPAVLEISESQSLSGNTNLCVVMGKGRLEGEFLYCISFFDDEDGFCICVCVCVCVKEREIWKANSILLKV